MAGPVKQKIPPNVAQISGPTQRHVRFVDVPDDDDDDEDGEVSLPVVSLMKLDALQIIQEMERFYRWNLGLRHPLTVDAQKQIRTLREQTGATDQRSGVWDTLRDWISSLTSLLTGGGRGGGATDDEEITTNT